MIAEEDGLQVHILQFLQLAVHRQHAEEVHKAAYP